MFIIMNTPIIMKVTKYAIAMPLYPHYLGPSATNSAKVCSVSVHWYKMDLPLLQSHMMLFHASPVHMRSKVSIDLGKL
jgi:hypothetical protein